MPTFRGLSAHRPLAALLLGGFLSSLLLSFPLPAFAAQTSADSLKGYWKFDETSGTSAADSSGDGNTGTLTNGPTISTDVPSGMAFADGRSLSFDGTNDFVSTPLTADFGTGNFTVSTWAKISVPSKFQYFVAKDNGTSRSWGLAVSATATNKVQWFSLVTLNAPVTSVTNLAANTWTHILVTRSGTAMSLYLNGVLEATGTDSSNYNLSNAIYLGARELNGDQAPTGGLLDDVRIYNRALVPWEIADLAAGRHVSTYWTGTTSTAFENKGNWSGSYIPDPYSKLVVKTGTNQPTMTGATKFSAITINTGAKLTLGGQNVTMNDGGTFTNYGQMLVKGTETLTSVTNDTSRGKVILYGTGSYSTFPTGNTYNQLALSGAGTWTLGAGLTVNGGLGFSGATLNANANTVLVKGLTVLTTGTYQASTAKQTLSGGLIVKGGTFTGSSGPVSVSGSLILSSGTLTAPSGTLTLAGDWNKTGGTFTHNSGTVQFVGRNQVLTGSLVFNNLTKAVSSADTFKLAWNGVLSVSGALTLRGVSGNVLTVRSTKSGTAARFILDGDSGTQTIDYLNVADSDATGGLALVCYTNAEGCTNAGGTTNWTFTDPATAAPTITSPTTGTLTNDNTPTISGTGTTIGNTIRAKSGSTVLCTTTVNNNAGKTWTCDSSALSDATYVFRATEDNGTESAVSNAVTVTIDATAPAAPGTPDLQAGSDTGTSSTDNITKTTTPTFTISCESAATVSLLSGATVLGTGTCASSTVSITSSALSTNGTYLFKAKQTDPAGNVSANSSTLSVTLDTVAPTVAQVTPVTTPTNDNTPDYVFSSTQAGTISYGGDCSSVTTSASVGNNTVTFNSLSDGAHSNCTITVTDTAGNASSALSVSAFTVDTVAPAAPGTPDLTAGSDTGSSSTDNITSNTTPAFTISCETAATVTLLSGATVLGTGTCSSSTVTITSSALTTNGVYSIKAKQTDAAGNVSATSSALSVTIDTANPSAPGTPDMTAGTDSGTSSTDNITSDTTPDFTISCESGATVTLKEGGTTVGTGTCASSTVTITSSSLSEASHTITATQTDAAGNTSSTSSGLSVTIDATAPATTGTPDLDAASDTGTSSTDNITNDTTPTLTATCENSATVQLLSGATVLASGTCSSGTVSLTSSVLTVNGVYQFKMRQTDPAGNVSTASAALSVTIDTSAPTLAEVTPVSTPTSDSTPDYVFSSTQAGTITYGGDCSSSTTSASVGNNTITFSTLGDGPHSNCTIVVTDVAGNASSSLAVTAFTVDTATPAAPGTPDLQAASDTGTSSADNITKRMTPTFTISCESAATVSLLSGATVLGTGTCASSTVSITSSALPDGDYAIKAKQTDPAGNVSANSSALTVTVDTTAPTVATLSPADDALDVAITDNLVLTFSELISKAGTGTLTIRKASDNSIVETITVSGLLVSGSGTTRLTVDPSVTLDYSTEYYVQITTAAFPDTAGNRYAGISNTTSWNFVTVAAPLAPSSGDSTAQTERGSGGSGGGRGKAGPGGRSPLAAAARAELIARFEGQIAASQNRSQTQIVRASSSRAVARASSSRSGPPRFVAQRPIPSSSTRSSASRRTIARQTVSSSPVSHSSTAPRFVVRQSTSSSSSRTRTIAVASTASVPSARSSSSAGAIAFRPRPAPIGPAPAVVVAAQRGKLQIITSEQDVVYNDVPVDSWYAPYVSLLIEGGIAVGYKDTAGNPTGEFGVGNSVTYAELAKMALEAAGKESKTPLPPPRNTSAQGMWASVYVALAEHEKLSVFTPSLNVQQPATRGAVIQTVLEAFGIPATTKNLANFSDLPPNHPHAQAISVALFYGLIDGDSAADGTPAGTVRPDALVNRAEVAKIIALAIKLLK
jgi:hypothetical protein